MPLETYIPTFCPIDWEQGYRLYGHGNFRERIAQYDTNLNLTKGLKSIHASFASLDYKNLCSLLLDLATNAHRLAAKDLVEKICDFCEVIVMSMSNEGDAFKLYRLYFNLLHAAITLRAYLSMILDQKFDPSSEYLLCKHLLIPFS